MLTETKAPADQTVPAANGQATIHRPFVAGARETTRPFHDRTAAIDTVSQSVGPVDVIAHGFMRHIVLLVEATDGADGAATVAVKEDAPFSILANVTLHDVAGDAIVNLSGYELYLANKYGAYQFLTDAKSSPIYEAPADANDGNFAFALRVPVEVSRRDGFGALINQTSSQTYKLSYEVAASSAVYSTPPDTLPTLRVRAYLEAFTRANSADFAGVPFHQAPPAHGSMQFWRRYVHSGLGAGQQTVKLPHVGNHLRTLILINKTSSARSTADFPASVTLNIDGNTLEGSIAKVWLQHRMAERYGLDGAIGAAGGLDTGVFVIDFCHDLDGKPGFETRDGYLPTTPATYLELSGVFGASADSLTILTNDVAIKHAA